MAWASGTARQNHSICIFEMKIFGFILLKMMLNT